MSADLESGRSSVGFDRFSYGATVWVMQKRTIRFGRRMGVVIDVAGSGRDRYWRVAFDGGGSIWVPDDLVAAP